MKQITIFLLTLGLAYGCIGTDDVEDTLTSIEILVPEDVTLVNGSFAKLVGQTAQLTSLGSSDLGGTFFLQDASWQSDNPAVITIDELGNVVAVSPGTAQVVATAFGISSEPININVVDDSTTVALIAIAAEDRVTVVDPGGTLQLFATALTAGGNEVPEVDFEWSSSDESVATVSADGLVTTFAEGSIAINALGAGVEGSLSIQVGSQESLSRSAALTGINGYDISGTAVLAASSTGALTLQLSDDFSAQNGPGLYLYLSNNRTNINGGVEIAALRSTDGSDVYQVPRTVELEDFSHVLIYCKPFGVGFGTGEFE